MPDEPTDATPDPTSGARTDAGGPAVDRSGPAGPATADARAPAGGPPPGGHGPAGEATPMAELRALLHDAQDAARRVREQAADALAAADDAPPGWSTSEERQERIDEVRDVARLVRTLRDIVPDELRTQLTQLLHNLLALARALIDWWMERLEDVPESAPGAAGPPDGRGPAGGPDRRTGPGSAVEDIPIG
ncbi:MAG: hypothetical protein AB7G37_12155 [Solirubrobacteraceae bacterium]